jgi:hypothetical protein
MRWGENTSRVRLYPDYISANFYEGYDMEYYDIPLIEKVSFLRGHDLLVRFENGEERIADMSEYNMSSSVSQFFENESKLYKQESANG